MTKHRRFKYLGATNPRRGFGELGLGLGISTAGLIAQQRSVREPIQKRSVRVRVDQSTPRAARQGRVTIPIDY